MYDLVIAKGGLKMKESTSDKKSMELLTDGKLTVRAMAIANLVVALPADGRLIVARLASERRDLISSSSEPSKYQLRRV